MLGLAALLPQPPGVLELQACVIHTQLEISVVIDVVSEHSLFQYMCCQSEYRLFPFFSVLSHSVEETFFYFSQNFTIIYVFSFLPPSAFPSFFLSCFPANTFALLF